MNIFNYRIKYVKAIDNVDNVKKPPMKTFIGDVAKDCLHVIIRPFLRKPKTFDDYFLPEVLTGFNTDGIKPFE